MVILVHLVVRRIHTDPLAVRVFVLPRKRMLGLVYPLVDSRGHFSTSLALSRGKTKYCWYAYPLAAPRGNLSISIALLWGKVVLLVPPLPLPIRSSPRMYDLEMHFQTSPLVQYPATNWTWVRGLLIRIDRRCGAWVRGLLVRVDRHCARGKRDFTNTLATLEQQRLGEGASDAMNLPVFNPINKPIRPPLCVDAMSVWCESPCPCSHSTTSPVKIENRSETVRL